jgi:hypothetical protein
MSSTCPRFQRITFISHTKRIDTLLKLEEEREKDESKFIAHK